MKRTTIFVEEELWTHVRLLARRQGKSVAEIVREALRAFVRKQTHRSRRLSWVGIGRSGRSDVAERHEELLWNAREAS